MSLRHFRKLAAVAVLAVATPAAAGPILTVTEGTGPAERVVEYRLDPEALTFRVGDTQIQRLIGAIETNQAGLRARAEFDTGLQLFGDAYGGLGVIGTLGEQALGLDALSGVNGLMTHAGLVFAIAQIASDLEQGRNESAAVGAYKAAFGYAVGTLGWGALQVAGTSLYFIDITLREWEAGLRQSYLDRYRPGLQRFFREDRAVRRDLNDWTRRVWTLYLQAEREAGDLRDADANRFRDLMDTELTAYVRQANMLAVSVYLDPRQTGGGGSGLNDQILAALQAEHKIALEAMLARDVLPRIAQRARERQLRNLVARMNRDLVSEMNRPIRLEVTAWGVPAGTAVRIPGRAGDWGGPLGADGTFTLEFTRHAWLKAGLPQRILLEGPGGTMEEPLTVLGDQAVAIFGEPQAPMITRLRLTEGERSCRLTRYTPTRQFIDSEGWRFPAQPPVQLDTAMLLSGKVIAGIYNGDTGRWEQASPAVYLYGTQLHFGPPRLNGLAIMDNCNTSFFTASGEVATGQCRFIRQSERMRGNELLQMRCESDGEVTLIGGFLEMEQGMQYFPLDGAAGDVLSDIVRQSINEGVVGMTPDMLQGLTGTIPGMPPMPQMPQMPGGN